MIDNNTFIEEPKHCPSCNSDLEKVRDQLFCRNLVCPAQANKKIEHYAKTVGIKGLGPATIRKLGILELTEIYYYDLSDMIDTLGEKVALKLNNEIQASKQVNLATFLSALSIPLIGGTASEKLGTVVTSLGEINEEACKKAGLGEKATANLLEWLAHEGKEIIPFLPFEPKAQKSSKVENLKTVCITGKLKSFNKKADAEQALAAAGFKLVDSVTKSTDYLVDEGNSTSTKRTTAEKYGICIINDLNDLINKKENT